MSWLASDSSVHTLFCCSLPRGTCYDASGMTLCFNQYHLFLTLFCIYLFVFSVVKIICQDMKIIAYIILFAPLIFTPVRGLVQLCVAVGCGTHLIL